MSSNYRILVMVGVLIASTSYASPSEPAPDLIALIPTQADLVAGMEARHRGPERPNLFIPLPWESLHDIDYFNSLCGADPAKTVSEVILVNGGVDRLEFAHTLLARGRFNSEILYRSALGRGAVEESYRGLPVLLVPPLAREHSELNEFTSLAVLDSRVLLFGTQEYVRQEMDRFIAGSGRDPWFAQQITAVQRSDVWWVIRKPFNTSVVKDALMRLSPALAQILTRPNVSVGMRYGRQARFEYHLEISSTPERTWTPDSTLPESPDLNQFAAVSDQTTRYHGVIKVPCDQYRRWVAEIAARPINYR
jgi:hypothetical protein